MKNEFGCITQYEKFELSEARHRKYKRLELGGGHEYDCSSD
jgi:hypothetical protein